MNGGRVVADTVSDLDEGQTLGVQLGCLLNFGGRHGRAAKLYTTSLERTRHCMTVHTETRTKLTNRCSSPVISDGLINFSSRETVDSPVHWTRR